MSSGLEIEKYVDVMLDVGYPSPSLENDFFSKHTLTLQPVVR